MIIALKDCPENTKCILIDSKIPDSLKNRLMGMGWIPGKTIQVVRRAPMGDPTIYLVDSTKIFLREEESRLITVKPIYPAPLSIVEKGTYKIVEFFGGGPRFVERAKTSGLAIGKTIYVIDNVLRGKLTVKIDDRVLRVGRGFSEKIFVEPIDV